MTQFAGSLATYLCMLLLALPATSAAQTSNGKVSAAPGGVPVPHVPADSRGSGVALADTAPVSRVFRVRVLDGRNGLPVEHAHLRLWYDDEGGSAFALQTDARGIALMPAPVGLPVRVLLASADRVDCRHGQTQNLAGQPPEGYNLQAIADTGTASTNVCGHVAAKPGPGELVFFVRPLRWYEGINR